MPPQQRVPSTTALTLLSVGLLGVVALIVVAQESSRYLGLGSAAAGVAAGRAAGAGGCASGAGGRQPSDVQLRSRVLKEPSLQQELWQLARKAGSAQEFGAQLEQQGLVLSAPAAAGTAAAMEQLSEGDGNSGSLHGSGSSSTTTTFLTGGRGSSSAGGGSGSGGGEGSSAGTSDNRGAGVGDGAAGTTAAVTVPPLSRELAQAHAHDNTIIVTWANFHFSDFALNWARHLAALGISHFLVGAMDVETAEVLAGQGVPVFAMFEPETQRSSGLTTGDFGWGSPTFHKMGRQKVALARVFTSFGLDLCLCDVDTVWINDPTPYFARFPAAHILASSDQLNPTQPAGGEGLEDPAAIHSALNIGLIFFRHSTSTLAFLDAWQAKLESDESVWDQNAFNWLIHEGLVPLKSHPSNDRLVWGCNGSVVVGILPVASFSSGHTFFVQKLFQVQQVQPYVVHTTFQYGGTKGKRHRLREALLWADEPSYYAEGRFLSMELALPDIPPDFDAWQDKEMQEYHLAGMRGQLRQLQAALGLAVALNRTLIMPKLLCFCDRYWGPLERCRVPGALATRLPFVCPMDHVLEPFHFDDKPGELGPAISFREYSFLANPRTPQALQESRVVVVVREGSRGDPAAESTEGQAAVVLPLRQNDEQLRQLLAAHQAAPLLHVAAPLEQAFGGFAQPADREGFCRRLEHLPGFWCCKSVAEGEDGGVSYLPMLQPPS